MRHEELMAQQEETDAAFEQADQTLAEVQQKTLDAKVALQAVLNVAVVTNTIPNTGISLPFFSSGGTSLMMLLGEMGIVLSVSRGET